MMKVFLGALLALAFVACSHPVRYAPSELNQFSPAVQEHIKKAEVTLGMSPAAVRLSWGPPTSVTVMKPDAQGNYREEWIYTKAKVWATRLVFTDQKLTGFIQGLAPRKPLFKQEPAAPEQETAPGEQDKQ
jgi:hypothetical protein